MSESQVSSGADALSTKLRSWHLDRRAIVYVRQSTQHQVMEHRESTARQYALAERAIALGWRAEQVDVIDDDQGISGQSIQGRFGFQRLLAEVGLDQVGIVLGLEMSRLARSCKDWHQLLELCSIFRTLLGDQDGIYDPTEFNDRLLLGLKGTMSEAEIHILKSRMHQGRMNKAQRGELILHPPLGYVYNTDKTSYEFDPDEQAQAVVKLVFHEFERQGTLYSLLRYLAKNDIRLPVRPIHGVNRGQLEWRRPNRTTLNAMLHHPTYAGAYRFGYRYHDPRKRVAGKRSTGIVRIPLDDCRVLIKNRFPAYISWEHFERNRRQLSSNQSRANAQGAPRCGAALLAGLLYCGRCGKRLMIQYSGRANRLRYQCARHAQNLGEPLCQGISGADLDRFISDRVFKVLEPASLQLSLIATEDLEKERERLNQHWRQRIERAKNETDRCARQYQYVEPENRLVARTLEKQWEAALREQEKLTAEYNCFRRTRSGNLTDEQQALIRDLSQNIPRIWHAPSTTPAHRQQIVRMLVDRIDLNIDGQTENAAITITWAGGFSSQHQYVRPISSYSQLSNIDDLIETVLQLKTTCSSLKEVADQLNESGCRSLHGKRFTGATISRMLVKRGIHSPLNRLSARPGLADNEWHVRDLAERLGMPRTSLLTWLKRKWVNGRKLPGKNDRWIIWADDAELTRLERLRSARRSWSDCPYPTELTTPITRHNVAS